jgi:putative transposase
MKKTAFTEEQIAYALRQAETGTPVADICRKLGVSEQTFYRWKKKFAGMGIAELGGVGADWSQESRAIVRRHQARQ